MAPLTNPLNMNSCSPSANRINITSIAQNRFVLSHRDDSLFICILLFSHSASFVRRNLKFGHQNIPRNHIIRNTMASPNVVNYLTEQKKTNNKELAAEWTQLEELYNEK